MTNEEIHNIYLHISGKAEGIAEATGSADFPVMFARAILEFDRLQRPWIGLTDEDIKQGKKESWVSEQAFESAVWWAEAKLREKNQ